MTRSVAATVVVLMIAFLIGGPLAARAAIPVLADAGAVGDDQVQAILAGRTGTFALVVGGITSYGTIIYCLARRRLRRARFRAVRPDLPGFSAEQKHAARRLGIWSLVSVLLLVLALLRMAYAAAMATPNYGWLAARGDWVILAATCGVTWALVAAHVHWREQKAESAPTIRIAP